MRAAGGTFGQVEHLARSRQAEVAARVVHGVGHQPQVGQRRAGGKALQGLVAEHEIGCKYVAGHHPEHRVQARQGPHDAAGGLQRTAKVLAFMRITDVHLGQAWPVKQIAEMCRDLLAQPGGVDQLLHKAAPGQGLHGPLHERLAAHAQQGLGGLVGQRAHARAATGGQHHGLGGRSVAERGRLRWVGK